MFTAGGSTTWSVSTEPFEVESPTRWCDGEPFTSSSATTKISLLDGSITGVPVIPTVGLMSPQGRSDAGTGVARCCCHWTWPVEADRATTVSFSVAAKTEPLKMRGSP